MISGLGTPRTPTSDAPFVSSGNPVWDEIQRAHSTLSPAAQRAVSMSGVPQRMEGAEAETPAPISAAPASAPPPAPRPISAPSSLNVRGLGSPPAPSPILPAAPPPTPEATAHLNELNRVTAPPLPAQIPRIGSEGQFLRMQDNPLAHTKADTGRSGIGQIKNPFVRHGLGILDAIGSAFLPNLTSMIPGTELHHRDVVDQARETVTADTSRAKVGAETEEASAHAQSLRNPKSAISTPFQAWLAQNPGKPAEEWLKTEAAAEYHPADQYADFKASYAKEHPEASVADIVAAFATKGQKTTLDDQYSDAVADAFERGVDPTKDPKVAQLAGAIQEKMRQPAPKVPAKDDKYIAIMSKPDAERTPEELAYAKGYEKWVDKTKVQPGVTRMEVLATTRPVAVLDTKNGNAPVTINVEELNRAAREEPGRYLTSGPGVTALNKTALLEDIRGNVQQVRQSLQSMPDFDAMDKAKIALALRHRDARGAISALINGAAAGSLSVQQQEYLINVTNLIENAMAMRSVLGAGQGSDDLRAAIMATIPGPTTPSREFAMKQLDTFERVLDRLGAGVPKVPLRTDTGGGAEIKEVKTKAEYDALPSGAVYMEDGKKFKKP